MSSFFKNVDLHKLNDLSTTLNNGFKNILNESFLEKPYLYKLDKTFFHNNIKQYITKENMILFKLFEEPSKCTLSDFSEVITQLSILNNYMLTPVISHFLLLVCYRFVKVHEDSFRTVEDRLIKYKKVEEDNKIFYENSIKNDKEIIEFYKKQQGQDHSKISSLQQQVDALNLKINSLLTEVTDLEFKLNSVTKIPKKSTNKTRNVNFLKHKLNYHKEYTSTSTNQWLGNITLAEKIKKSTGKITTRTSPNTDYEKVEKLSSILSDTHYEISTVNVDKTTNNLEFFIQDDLNLQKAPQTTFIQKNVNGKVAHENYYKDLNHEEIEWI